MPGVATMLALLTFALKSKLGNTPANVPSGTFAPAIGLRPLDPRFSNPFGDQ